jgi:hypothetical protein
MGGVMGWANHHIEKLKQGETVKFRPKGNSMIPKIKSGQLCTVEPVDPKTLVQGDIVLCRVKGCQYVHLVSAIQGERYQISNNKGHINGWVGANCIFGKLKSVED